jgi:N-acetylmuramoyl-L-alanine amidase
MFRAQVRRVSLPLAAALVALGAPVVAEAAVTAHAVATPNAGGIPLTVAFDASGSTADAAIVAYNWDFGDGNVGSGAIVSHVYTVAGRYTATLTVTDATGESGTATVDVTAQAVTLALNRARAVYGSTLTAGGTVVPAEEGLAVAVERLNALGSWDVLAITTTDATGAFTASFAAAGRGPVRARVDATGAVSAGRALSVVPQVVVNQPSGQAFLGAQLAANVAPVAYTGRVVITVMKYSRVVGRVAAWVVDGRLRVRIPTPGLGRFYVRLAFPAGGDVDAVRVPTHAYTTARTLSVGSTGAAVEALERRLKQLRFRVPGVDRYFGTRTFDSVVAFQKAWGLARTGIVGAGTWNMLGRARILRPRYGWPSPHLEVDKSRQILMLVRRGRVAAVIPISSGATGNTPEGAFRILWKAPATSTWLGPGILYRTMTFHGNFAIHGYYSVPVYPASHGCVRVPIWLADWLYDRSYVGERVFIYP